MLSFWKKNITRLKGQNCLGWDCNHWKQNNNLFYFFFFFWRRKKVLSGCLQTHMFHHVFKACTRIRWVRPSIDWYHYLQGCDWLVASIILHLPSVLILELTSPTIAPVHLRSIVYLRPSFKRGRQPHIFFNFLKNTMKLKNIWSTGRRVRGTHYPFPS